MAMTFVMRLIFLYGLLHSIAYLRIILSHEEIIDQG